MRLQYQPTTTGDIEYAIKVDGEAVTVDGDPVYVTKEGREDSAREVIYVVATEDDDGYTEITFATYSSSEFLDWGTDDAPAYIITGYSSLGDFQRMKQIPCLTLHFNRTETGFDEDFNLQNESSCLTRVAWDWANSSNSNKWSKQFQGYRYKKFYMPADSDDSFDTGFETITTRNKIRGRGRVFSLRMETEAGKDCQLLGWSLIIGVNSSV